MSIYKKENKFLSLLIILVAFFILVFFTRNIFYEVQETLDVNSTLSSTNISKGEELSKLEILENDLKNGDKKKEVSRFLNDFTEDDMILYIHDYVEATNKLNAGNIIIRDLSFEKGVEGELGFEEAKISVDVKVSDITTLERFLEFLTSKDSKYTFFISDFSFPNDGRVGDYIVSIPLRLFYK